jgi:signal transduction histidine kinase
MRSTPRWPSSPPTRRCSPSNCKGDARLGPVLDKITQQSFRAAEIANGLLNFSRTSTTEFRETNLNQVIRDTLSLLEHQFKTAQIVVDLDLAEELPPIHGNPGKLQQVFLNLLLNAKEAMPGGGRLRVATLSTGTSKRCLRLRQRHRSRAPQAHLRSVLHHQDHAQARGQARHRTGPLRLLRHHSGTCGQDSCRERGRRRHNLSS